MLERMTNSPLKKIFLGVLVFHLVAVIFLSFALKTRASPIQSKMLVRSIVTKEHTPISPTAPKVTTAPQKSNSVQAKVKSTPQKPAVSKKKKVTTASVAKTKSPVEETKAASTTATSSKALPIPKPISFLSIENSDISHTQTLEQVNYSSLLVQFLEDRLMLPEKGEVKLQLSLNKEGKVVSIDILKAESVKNREYLKNTLPQLSFPCFNTSVSEMQCSYTIRFLSQK